MKRLLYLLPLALLLLAGCKEKGSFSNVEIGESWLCRLVFEDESFKDYVVTADVLYAGEDTSSRYKMVFYMPEGWDDSYPIFLDRYVPCDRPAWQAYQGVPVAEDALKEGNMIVVLVAYSEWTAIPDILLAEAFLKQHDADLPGDSRNILTAADFDFETAAYYDFE
jgi:hypothetical protein